SAPLEPSALTDELRAGATEAREEFNAQVGTDADYKQHSTVPETSFRQVQSFHLFDGKEWSMSPMILSFSRHFLSEHWRNIRASRGFERYFQWMLTRVFSLNPTGKVSERLRSRHRRQMGDIFLPRAISLFHATAGRPAGKFSDIA